MNRKLCSGHRIAPVRQIDGSVLTDDASKAAAFKAYFFSVFTQASHNHGTPTHHPTFTSDTVSFTPDIVFKALSCAKNTLSSGPDAIPSLFWSKVAAAVTFPVSVLFTASYVFSTLPSEWKTAIVQPLYKKGDPCTESNYRPISLTCTLCKIMEGIVKDNLLNFALSNNIITNNQHGFLPGRSACTQMLDCQYDWRCALDRGDFVDIILIDFSKAFMLCRIPCLSTN